VSVGVSASTRYAVSAAALLAVLTLALLPFLEGGDRVAVAASAAVALVVQVIAFAILIPHRGKVTGFMGAWLGGMALRAIAVVGVAFVVIRSGSESAVAALISLAGFLFVLVLLESKHFQGPRPDDASLNGAH
jgi:hypothetical protein